MRDGLAKMYAVYVSSMETIFYVDVGIDECDFDRQVQSDSAVVVVNTAVKQSIRNGRKNRTVSFALMPNFFLLKLFYAE